ncbi:hypothetical protein HMPREF0497_1080 [Lentilactobacillus buchneri ATCC 11577]|nr:hypothetical protein HMPREF0497_1080 [Lentilactobacillus buchneri ATCC 11577]
MNDVQQNFFAFESNRTLLSFNCLALTLERMEVIATGDKSRYNRFLKM